MCDEYEEQQAEPENIPAYPFRWTMALAWVVRFVAGVLRVFAGVADEIETDILAMHNCDSLQRSFANDMRAEIESIPTTQE